MMFQTYGNRNHPAVLFFHAMGVTGESSEPIANYLQDRYFCILPTSTVYCKGQKYANLKRFVVFLHGIVHTHSRNIPVAGQGFF